MRRAAAPVVVVAPDSPCLEWCSRCRARAAGLGQGPYTPAEMAVWAVAPAVSPVAADPQVMAATAARDKARAVFDAVDDVFGSALAANRAADLSGSGDATDRRRLAEAEDRAREARDATWTHVVAASDALRGATLQVQARVRGD